MKPPHRPGRQYTLLVLRDEGQITRLRVSARTLKLLLIPLALLIALAVYLTVDYARTKISLARWEGGSRSSGAAVTPGLLAATTPGAPTRPASEADLWRQVDARAVQLAPFDRFFAAQQYDSFALPERWPVRGWVVGEFGRHFNRQTGRWEMNYGLDIAAPLGADVVAVAPGVVLLAVDDSSAGKYVAVRHGHGLTSVYTHLEHTLVVTGQQVRGGEAVGQVGGGQGAGAYVHYEVRLHNVPLDPWRYLP